MKERDEYRCVKCGKSGMLEVDHIEPMHKGGETWNPSNLQTLCQGCHIAKTRREQPDNRKLPPEPWARLVAELLESA